MFVVRHVGTARLDTLDKVERVETNQVEFGPYSAEQVIKQQVWGGGACIHCYTEVLSALYCSDDPCLLQTYVPKKQVNDIRI